MPNELGLSAACRLNRCNSSAQVGCIKISAKGAEEPQWRETPQQLITR
jgi:hypothetical protein